MKPTKRGLCLLCAFLAWGLASTTASLAQTEDRAGTLEVRSAEPAALTVWNRPVVVLRASIDGISPRERAEGIRRRIEELPLEGAEIRSEPASVRRLEGIALFADSRMLFGVLPQDLDPESSESLEEVVGTAVLRIEEILETRAEALRPAAILKGLAYSMGSLLLLVLFVWGVLRIRRLSERLHPPHYLQDVRVYEFDVTPVLSYLGRSAVQILSAGLVLFAVYIFVAFALSQFPRYCELARSFPTV